MKQASFGEAGMQKGELSIVALVEAVAVSSGEWLKIAGSAKIVSYQNRRQKISYLKKYTFLWLCSLISIWVRLLLQGSNFTFPQRSESNLKLC